jgi:Family of unknown function (DUF6361)
MTSAFGWLDNDGDQRRRMLAVVELFKDEGTVDELGIGAIRDTIAGALFPGTSVLHQRPRYMLFVPWLLLRAQQTVGTAPAASAELRRLEIRLIYSLLAGGETYGVIGRQAKDDLKRMPSAAYWGALRRYGIRLWDTTIEGHFRRAIIGYTRRRTDPDADEPGGLGLGEEPSTGLDPNLPIAPSDLLTAATFDLTAKEAGFLRDRLLATTTGSLLAWLLLHANTVAAEQIWLHPSAGTFPAELRRVVEHGRRFHTVIHGAAVLYNLMLAEQCASQPLVEEHRGRLEDWVDEMADTRALEGWDPQDFWAMLGEQNPRIGPSTRVFVSQWVQRAELGAQVANDVALRALIKQRETQLKGGRARLVNTGALDQWRGRSGLVRLDYNWAIAGRMLADIYAAPAVEMS